jgi:hypothetical protein
MDGRGGGRFRLWWPVRRTGRLGRSSRRDVAVSGAGLTALPSTVSVSGDDGSVVSPHGNAPVVLHRNTIWNAPAEPLPTCRHLRPRPHPLSPSTWIRCRFGQYGRTGRQVLGEMPCARACPSLSADGYEIQPFLTCPHIPGGLQSHGHELRRSHRYRFVIDNHPPRTAQEDVDVFDLIGDMIVANCLGVGRELDCVHLECTDAERLAHPFVERTCGRVWSRTGG